ncbi:hypothetical protein QBC34DRAFT_413438 [Podospora aff. communis PSN243]|uniref:Nudix hydrolase domain-containing protein n=1 Tax=Podospora aff. communis PSN243 TaxID=3040156 RepID=A0AAV9GCW3_9PEZI|nr:hypothetical protein QBC34DRAFT_413438 [Podospora aff. communis PSN243]
MSKFTLEGFGNPVPVTLTPDITESQLLSFPPFQTWRSTLQANLKLQKDEDHVFHRAPFTLRSITVQSVDWFTHSQIGSVTLAVEMENQEGKILPGTASLRGGSVAVLMVLKPKDSRDERLVVMTEQPRVPAGSLSFMEIPAGMLDHENNFVGAAAKEILEETGFKILASELIDMTELALRESRISEAENLQSAMYPSPGRSDERMAIFLWEKELDRQEIESLRGKVAGRRTSEELIKLRVCDYGDLWRLGARDAKTLAASALYEGINRSGVLQAELKKRRWGERMRLQKK